MRLIVACKKCGRQYDATGRPIGSRFRCHCSAPVTVVAPRGHDARVVRCSACGAPREEGADECSFCHSRFTLHERDLDTVCPHCFSRISDTAKFCHSCGQALNVEMAAGEITEMQCPSCEGDVPLISRKIGRSQVPVMECQTCTGLWVANGTFEKLTGDASRQADSTPILIKKTVPNFPPAASDGHWKYRACVVCGSLMNRTQYGHDSGVIIDVCKDHGVWFDANELARILAWIRAGGLSEASKHQREIERVEALNKRLAAGNESIETAGWFSHSEDGWTATGRAAISLLAELFLR